ncbi:MAG TPA: hypothetical protein VFC29_25870, partial [Candidatus Limnocylindrales bacterium]|nr:hypothetical protein [Candidatus Limnocylindrales bacterium]
LRESPDTANFQLAAELGGSCAPSDAVAHRARSRANNPNRIENCLATDFMIGILSRPSSIFPSRGTVLRQHLVAFIH